jgi:hypothetical protein
VWFWLWTALVSAWLVGVFFGLRWLWRQLAALMAAVEAAGTAAEAAGGRASFTPAPVPEVALFASPQALAARQQARWRRIKARRQRRRDRHQAAYDSWAVLAGWRD